MALPIRRVAVSYIVFILKEGPNSLICGIREKMEDLAFVRLRIDTRRHFVRSGTVFNARDSKKLMICGLGIASISRNMEICIELQFTVHGIERCRKRSIF